MSTKIPQNRMEARTEAGVLAGATKAFGGSEVGLADHVWEIEEWVALID